MDRHGLYEHSNSNAYAAKLLSEQGFEVLSFDMRGHGKSEGIKGFLENMDTVLNDMKNFIKVSEKEYAEKTPNKYVMGYSFGGLFANLLALAKPNYFNGSVLIAPSFLDFGKYDKYIKIAKLINKIYPTFGIVKFKADKPRNPDIINYLNSDPLIYKGKIRVGTGITILEAMDYARKNIGLVNTPFYLLQGKDDTVSNPKGADIFYENTKINDKIYILLDGKLFN